MTNAFFHYTDCGLDDVYLKNGYTIDDEGNLFIKDIHGLHRTIGISLVFLGRKLKGKEIRFIRHYLDWSQKTLGEFLGVDYQTILRWESGKNKITKSPEKLLRLTFYGYLNKDARIVESIDTISDIDNNRKDEKISLSFKNAEWKTAA